MAGWRWRISTGIAVLVLAVLSGLRPGIAAGDVTAADSFRTLRLADGSVINLGAQAQPVEQAINSSRLAELVDGFLRRGLLADAAAILAYAVRYRPDRAGDTVDVAITIANQHHNIPFSELAFAAISAEPAASPAFLADALLDAIPDIVLRKAVYRAAGLPLPGDNNEALNTADAAGESDASTNDARSADSVFGGSLLPEALRIGGGASSVGGNSGADTNSTEPGPDGGAS